MSRLYEVSVEVSGHDASRGARIKDAARAEWGFDEDWLDDEGLLQNGARGSLCGGETEDEFAGRLALAIFEANGGPCSVSVFTTCLEDLPFETYSFDAEDLPDGYVPMGTSRGLDGPPLG